MIKTEIRISITNYSIVNENLRNWSSKLLKNTFLLVSIIYKYYVFLNKIYPRAAVSSFRVCRVQPSRFPSINVQIKLFIKVARGAGGSDYCDQQWGQVSLDVKSSNYQITPERCKNWVRNCPQPGALLVRKGFIPSNIGRRDV